MVVVHDEDAAGGAWDGSPERPILRLTGCNEGGSLGPAGQNVSSIEIAQLAALAHALPS